MSVRPAASGSVRPVEVGAPSASAAPAPVHRIEVHPSPRAGDPLGESVRTTAAGFGIKPSRVRTARVYLISADLSREQLEAIRSRLLTDPILEESNLGARALQPGDVLVEVHPLPGVMDPAAQTVRETILEVLDLSRAEVSTGRRFDFTGITAEQADILARRLLANTVIEAIHRSPFHPERFPRAHLADQTLRRVDLTSLDDEALLKLSREGHLFLSLDEMRAIQAHYRRQGREPTDIELETLAQTWSEHCVHKTLKSTILYRESSSAPSTASSPIDWRNRPGHSVNPDGSITIRNLLKSTIAAATHELIADGLDWTLSVFKDNSGVIRFDDQHAVCVKVETHNHPSAIEPYGGAATGVGGCIRDVIGTGLGARPIANTDVFCVAFPDACTAEYVRVSKDQVEGGSSASVSSPRSLPPGCLHPRRVLTRVVDGVRDYGNRMGIPTVNGAVYFDDRYVGNPLVFCGCVGVMPVWAVKGEAKPGDRIIAVGGRTGRDGIHGATFSSAELEHTAADEFAHAVQIGNAITEKRMLDAILRARDGDQRPDSSSSPRCLFHALTDCGAGGFSSAVGEMAAKLGATVHLDRAPLKYEGLRYDEIWISESQERMVLAVPPHNLPALQHICAEEGVEMADLGEFGRTNAQGEPELLLLFRGREVGRLSMPFLHDGIPMPTRESVWIPPSPRGGGGGQVAAPTSSSSPSSSRQSISPSSSVLSASSAVKSASPIDIKYTLLRLLAHPNIASRRWIVRQYDHEVQGNTIIKPLVGPGGIGPGDAAVIQPVPGSKQGLAVACGLQVPVGDVASGGDPYLMALAAVDECVRNLVCVGADPGRIAILDNFCWPGCQKPENLASLVRAAEGCYDAAKAYRTPFVSGKDSLNNQFRYRDESTGKEVLIEIPPTLLITGIGIVPDVSRCATMDLKPVVQSRLLLIGASDAPRDRSLPAASWHDRCLAACRNGPTAARLVARIIEEGWALAAHDCSEGGLLVAVAEMLIAAASDGEQPALGLMSDLRDLAGVNLSGESGDAAQRRLFDELPGAYLLQVPNQHVDRVVRLVAETGRLACEATAIGTVTPSSALEIRGVHDSVKVSISDLRAAFLGTLDW